MCIPRAATISPASRTTYWCQPGRPGTGVEAVDALEERDPLGSGRGRDGLHRQIAVSVGNSRDRERAVVADDSILGVERLEPELAQPVLVVGGLAVRQGLEQEAGDPGPLVAVEDLLEHGAARRLDDAETDRAAEIATPGRSPAKHERPADFARCDPCVGRPTGGGGRVGVSPGTRLGCLERGGGR
jgi:hypothetical protein